MKENQKFLRAAGGYAENDRSAALLFSFKLTIDFPLRRGYNSANNEIPTKPLRKRITHSDMEWYVGNAENGTQLGYKHFSIQDNTALRVTARGNGRVQVALDGEQVGTLSFHSESWAAEALTISRAHVHAALRLTVTEGSLDILSLHFSPEVTK